MSHLLVYATTLSRLHADLLIVRLKQADVATSQISVLHPKASRPNSTRCWLNGSTRLPLSSGEMISAAGSLGQALRRSSERGVSDSLTSRLNAMGFSASQSHDMDERLLENRIIVAIDVSGEFELPAIFRAMRSVAAEDIQAVNLQRVRNHAEERYFSGSQSGLTPLARLLAATSGAFA
jgi:hypothetical protein